MGDSGNAGPGGSGPVHGLGSSVLGLLRTRLELFALELQEEKLRAARLLVWAAVVLALVVAAVLLLVGTLALFLWRAAGYAGLIGLTALVLAAAVALYLAGRRRILGAPAPFSATAAEFHKDMECLRPDSN